MIIQDVVTVAQAAIVTSYAGGAALTLAIAGSMVEAMYPGAQNRMGVRVWEALVSALSVALRVFLLVTGARAVKALAVTYLHTGARYQRHGHVTRGRHRPDHIRTHPASSWQARGAVTA